MTNATKSTIEKLEAIGFSLVRTMRKVEGGDPTAFMSRHKRFSVLYAEVAPDGSVNGAPAADAIAAISPFGNTIW